MTREVTIRDRQGAAIVAALDTALQVALGASLDVKRAAPRDGKDHDNNRREQHAPAASRRPLFASERHAQFRYETREAATRPAAYAHGWLGNGLVVDLVVASLGLVDAENIQKRMSGRNEGGFIGIGPLLLRCAIQGTRHGRRRTGIVDARQANRVGEMAAAKCKRRNLGQSDGRVAKPFAVDERAVGATQVFNERSTALHENMRVPPRDIVHLMGIASAVLRERLVCLADEE